jgi:hypothetical protein
MEGDQNKVSSFSRLSKERKHGFFLLLVFAFVAVVLIGVQMRNTVYGPFALNKSIPTSLKEQIVDNNIDYQKVNDTDHDGLSDFDEKYVYNTSPFLYDTFGYGISDKEVVQKGLPLCPGAGKNCTGGLASAGATDDSSATSTVVRNVLGISESEMVGPAPADLTAVLSDPAQVRQLLLQTGSVDKEMLKKISDNDLLKMVSQIMAATSTQQNLLNLTNISATTSTR